MSMQNFQDNDLDDFFRKSSENARLAFNPKAWDLMDKKLVAAASAKKIFHRRLGYALVLLLLITASSVSINELYFKQEGKRGNSITKVENDKNGYEKANTVNKRGILIKKRMPSSGSNENSFLHKEDKFNNSAVAQSDRQGLQYDLAMFENVPTENHSDNNEEIHQRDKPVFGFLNPMFSSSSLALKNTYFNFKSIPVDDVEEFKENGGKEKNKKLFSRDLMRIGVFVSPDLSSTFPFKNLQSGYNTGVAIEYFILRNLSISTGVFKSRKIYTADAKTYNSGGYSNPTSNLEGISANCMVTDIPVNVKYYYCDKLRLRAFAGIGVSNYLMRKETYVYEYSTYDKTYSYSKENNHLFSILNLSTGAELRIGNKFAVGIEPFLKVATRGVGAGKIKLNSGGAFISVNYTLLKK